jgi:hypothetical protein
MEQQMDKPADITQEVPVIDQRLLAAVERNVEFLGLTEWLEKYTTAVDEEPHPRQHKGRQSRS